MFCHPLPNQRELKTFYEQDFNYAWYSRRWILKKIQGIHRWIRVRELVKDTRPSDGWLLDIGCGHGWFLNAAHKSGWRTTGVELPSSAADFARDQLSVDVVIGELGEISLPAQSFRLVTLWHSLEHVINPGEIMLQVARLLGPGGHVVIALPNRNALGLARKKQNWVWLQPPFVHIWHFSPNALKRLLESCQLRVVSVTTRDTWDAQLLYDGWFGSYLHNRYVLGLLRLTGESLRTIKLQFLAKGIEAAYFLIDEFLRVAFYVLYLMIRPFLSTSLADRGSELMVVATNSNNPSAIDLQALRNNDRQKKLTFGRLCRRLPQAGLHALTATLSSIRTYIRFRQLRKHLRNTKPDSQLVAIGLLEHIGDIVSSEPVVRQIRQDHPNAFLIWCVREPYRELVESFALTDAVISVRCLTEWILLRQIAPFDQIGDLHMRGQACSICAIPLRKPEDSSGINLSNYYNSGSLTAVRARVAGVTLTDTQPRLKIPKSISIPVHALSLPEHFVTIHGRSEQAVREWVDNRWSELLQRISTELGLSVVEIGLTSVLHSTPEHLRAISLCGRLSILETAEVIRRSRLFIGIDSGPAHLANAVGTFGVLLFGKYFRFETYVPYGGSYGNGQNCEIIRAKGSLSDISVQQVFEVVAARLSARI
jgi:ADP-heptose:LPS heptosyltransferase/SAM-dependent methyltransferase